jgi:hypothetical protein
MMFLIYIVTNRSTRYKHECRTRKTAGISAIKFALIETEDDGERFSLRLQWTFWSSE